MYPNLTWYAVRSMDRPSTSPVAARLQYAKMSKIIDGFARHSITTFDYSYEHQFEMKIGPIFV